MRIENVKPEDVFKTKVQREGLDQDVEIEKSIEPVVEEIVKEEKVEEQEEKFEDKAGELSELKDKLEKLNTDFATLKDKKVEGKEKIAEKKKDQKDIKRKITQTKNKINALKENNSEPVLDEEKETEKPISGPEIKDEETEKQSISEVISELVKEGTEEKGREELEKKLLQVDKMLSLYKKRGRLLYHLKNLKDSDTEENEIANAQTGISGINYKIKGLYREITKSDIKGFPENEKRKVEEIMLAVEEGKMDYGKLAVIEDKEKETGPKENFMDQFKNGEDVYAFLKKIGRDLDENRIDIGKENIVDKIWKSTTEEYRGKLVDMMVDFAIKNNLSKDEIRNLSKIIEPTKHIGKINTYKWLYMIESESEKTSEIPEELEIEPKREKEPKTTREVIEKLGLLEELEMFESNLKAREKEKAEIEKYIDEKIKNGEKITQEDENKRDKASEEVQMADINVNTAKGVGASLEVGVDAEDEMRILRKKIEMQNLLLTQFEVLGEMKRTEDKNIEKLGSKKQRAAKRISNAVIDKIPKRFTVDKSRNQRTREQKKDSFWKRIKNKLSGSSAEEKENDEEKPEDNKLKEVVAVELLKILEEKNAEDLDKGGIKIKEKMVERVMEGLSNEYKNRDGIKEEIKRFRIKQEDLDKAKLAGVEGLETEGIKEETGEITEETPEIEILDAKEISEDDKKDMERLLSDNEIERINDAKDWGQLIREIENRKIKASAKLDNPAIVKIHEMLGIILDNFDLNKKELKKSDYNNNQNKLNEFWENCPSEINDNENVKKFISAIHYKISTLLAKEVGEKKEIGEITERMKGEMIKTTLLRLIGEGDYVKLRKKLGRDMTAYGYQPDSKLINTFSSGTAEGEVEKLCREMERIKENPDSKEFKILKEITIEDVFDVIKEYSESVILDENKGENNGEISEKIRKKIRKKIENITDKNGLFGGFENVIERHSVLIYNDKTIEEISKTNKEFSKMLELWFDIKSKKVKDINARYFIETVKEIYNEVKKERKIKKR